MTGAALSSFRLDIVSDTICPWCYVGKRRLAAALPILEAEGLTFDVTWRPFQLNPTMPREGLDRRYARGGGDYAEPQYGRPVLSWFNSDLNGQGRPLAGLGRPPRGGFN
jgi:hypothetical protein